MKRRHRRRLLLAHTYLMLKRGERYLPPVLRGVLGILLMGLGVLGFLPILGFWMIPLGLALLAHVENLSMDQLWTPPLMHNCAHNILDIHDSGDLRIIQYADQPYESVRP